MMKIPPVRNHRQSIRYSESEDNDVEDSINQIKFSPSKIKSPHLMGISNMLGKSEGQSSMLMSVNDEEIQLEIKNQNL